MSDTSEKTKAEELREKRVAAARQRIDRQFNAILSAYSDLTTTLRETGGLLNEDQASVLTDAIAARMKGLSDVLAVHVTTPAAGAKKKAKPVGVSLF